MRDEGGLGVQGVVSLGILPVRSNLLIYLTSVVWIRVDGKHKR